MSPAARHRAALRENVIARLRAHLAAHPPLGAERVILFGSVARGDFDGASDADVLVIGDGPLPDSSIQAAAEREVDLLPWTPAQWRRALAEGHPLAERVTHEGVELWRAGA